MITKIELLQKWIEALRSGEYKQGKKVLCRIVNGDCFYCCLGVLCEVAIKNGIEIEKIMPIVTNMETVRFGEHILQLPHVLTDFLEIGSFGELNKMVKSRSTLAGLNDCANYNFNQIADVVEEQFLKPLLVA